MLFAQIVVYAIIHFVLDKTPTVGIVGKRTRQILCFFRRMLGVLAANMTRQIVAPNFFLAVRTRYFVRPWRRVSFQMTKSNCGVRARGFAARPATAEQPAGRTLAARHEA